MADTWVQLGVVARAHGVRGALKLKLDNDASKTLREGLVVRVGDREHRVARYAGGVLTLVDVTDRDLADALRGKPLWVRRADFPEQGLYLVDLIGAPVFIDGRTETGAHIGVVHGFVEAGTQRLVIVKRPHDEVSVPYVSVIVIEASPQRMVLRPPPGLLDDDAIVVPQAPDDASDDASDDGDEDA
jgi:16S rRNA processing protein RimM